jgi:signal transduction histidine kinase
MASVLSGEGARGLAEEQAALHRVATLVARGVAPEMVFAAVTEEACRLLSVEYAHLGRFEPDATITILAAAGRSLDQFPAGRQWSLGGKNISTMVYETGRSARMDSFAHSSGALGDSAREDRVGAAVGTPIIVEGRLWGVMAAGSIPEQPLPADTEARLASFTDLVATAIANAESRAALARLAEEQAVLRRVATLVALGTPPEKLFAAVTEEAGRLLGTQLAGLARYESEDTVTVLATWAAEGEHPLVPGPWPLEGGDLASTISETGRSVRIDNYDSVPGAIATFVREKLGIRSSVGSPIVVDGRLWGALFIHSKQRQEPLPADTETRLSSFTELVATAIANAESRAELMASRARIVAAADETRRRIQRDLHDGIQQQLVSLGFEVRAAQTAPLQVDDFHDVLSRVGEGLTSVFDELREIARGIHPAILAEGGLQPALGALCRRSALPVELDLRADGRLPERVEVAAYYVVSEALANAVKHAEASIVTVELLVEDTTLHLAIRDDGIGGADPCQGSGLLGLSDRIEALGGTLQVISPAGNGTTLLLEIPLEGPISAMLLEPGGG